MFDPRHEQEEMTHRFAKYIPFFCCASLKGPTQIRGEGACKRPTERSQQAGIIWTVLFYFCFCDTLINNESSLLQTMRAQVIILKVPWYLLSNYHHFLSLLTDDGPLPYKTKYEQRHRVSLTERFTEADLKSLSELNPPSLMQNGNVGTPVKVFLQLIQSCRLPPRLIRKLGLTFPKTSSNRRYGNVPFQYRNTRTLPATEETIFTAAGHQISGPGTFAPRRLRPKADTETTETDELQDEEEEEEEEEKEEEEKEEEEDTQSNADDVGIRLNPSISVIYCVCRDILLIIKIIYFYIALFWTPKDALHRGRDNKQYNNKKYEDRGIKQNKQTEHFSKNKS